jgi:preprotein translocase subunit SecA
MISKRVAAAQKAVEAQNFAARKHLIEYDDVMNKQRQAVYGMRRLLLEGKEQRERILEIIEGIVGGFIDIRCPERVHPSQFDLTGLQSDVLSQFGVKINPQELSSFSRQEIENHIVDLLQARYKEKEDLIGPENMREAESVVMLNVIDNQWKDHLLSMDHLKEGIGMRAYGQKDPLIEYKKESFVLFQDMMDRIEDETVRFLFFLQITREPGEGSRPQLPFDMDEDGYEEDEEEEEGQPSPVNEQQRAIAQTSILDFTKNIQRKKEKEMAELQMVGGDGSANGSNKQVIKGDKVGRNDPCPCGSGKKYKKCHGAAA